MPDREKNSAGSHFFLVLFSMVAADPPSFLENVAIAQWAKSVKPSIIGKA
jgi:hypothetical protein